jgi:8-oxo-dGTP diphosphatase
MRPFWPHFLFGIIEGMKPMQLAGGIIRNETGEILLLHRNQSHLSQWEVPGGKVELQESPDQTVVRELREELGIIISIKEKIGSKVFSQIDRQWEYHWYEVNIVDGEVTICEPHIFDAIQYFKIADIHSQEDDMSPNVINLVTHLSKQ